MTKGIESDSAAVGRILVGGRLCRGLWTRAEEVEATDGIICV